MHLEINGIDDELTPEDFEETLFEEIPEIGDEQAKMVAQLCLKVWDPMRSEFGGARTALTLQIILKTFERRVKEIRGMNE